MKTFKQYLNESEKKSTFSKPKQWWIDYANNLEERGIMYVPPLFKSEQEYIDYLTKKSSDKVPMMRIEELKNEWDENKDEVQDDYDDFGYFLYIELSFEYDVPNYLTFSDFGLLDGRQLEPIEVLSWYMNKRAGNDFKAMNFPFKAPPKKMCGALTSFYDEMREEDLYHAVNDIYDSNNFGPNGEFN